MRIPKTPRNHAKRPRRRYFLALQIGAALLVVAVLLGKTELTKSSSFVGSLRVLANAGQRQTSMINGSALAGIIQDVKVSTPALMPFLHLSKPPEIERVYRLQDLHKLADPAGVRKWPAFQRDVAKYFYDPTSLVGADYASGWWINRNDGAIDEAGERRAYFGLLHGHTGLSDGVGTPEVAWTMAKDVARLDFMAVTDHPESWVGDEWADTWKNLQDRATTMQTPDFVPLVGFEYSHPVFGHYVVLNSHDYRSSFADATIDGFFSWLDSSAGGDPLVIFAHPGFHGYRASFEFEHFRRLQNPSSQRVIGMEVIHNYEMRPFMRGFETDASFLDEATSQGWKVGAVASQDNHKPNWGMRDDSRVGLLMKSLSRENIHEALKARRFYATMNNGLQFSVEIENDLGQWLPMGADVSRQALGDTARLRVRAFDPNDRHEWRHLEVISNGSPVSDTSLREINGADARPRDSVGRLINRWEESPNYRGRSLIVDATIHLPANVEEHALMSIYVRLWQGDHDQIMTQSSPIYIRW